MKKSMVMLLVMGVAALGLNGCARDISPNEYNAEAAGQISEVDRGIIIEIRKVTVKTDTSGVGAIAGGVAGGAIGQNLAGGHGTNSIVGTVAGAVVGGVVGNEAEKAIDTQKGFEYIIQLQNGSTISLTQGPSNLRIGDHVLVIHGHRARIVLDNAATLQQATQSVAPAMQAPAPVVVKPVATAS